MLLFKKNFAKKQDLALIVAQAFKLTLITTTVFFFYGFYTYFEQLKYALRFNAAHKYLFYKMYRLAALSLKDPLGNWLKQILIANLIVLTAYLLWKFLLSKIFKCGFDFQVTNRKKLKIYAAYIITFLFLIYSEITVNLKWASIQFSIRNVALNVGVLLAAVLLGWLLLNTKWEKLLKFIKFKYILFVTIPLTILLLVFSLIVFISAGISEKPSGPNIIIIVIDCLRADHVAGYGYSRQVSPTIDELYRSGMVFKRAYSNAPWTKPSVATIFTSLYPHMHNAVNSSDSLADETLTLSEILKNNGYKTAFFNGGNPIIGEKSNFYQGFDYFFESEIRATILTGQFLNYLSEMSEKRFFAYVHFMDLHLPFNKNEYNKLFVSDYENYFLQPLYINRRILRLATSKNAVTEKDKAYLTALYDGQIRFIDDSIKKIISTLKQQNMLENTVLIVTADHGEELWDHGNIEHGHSLYNELLHVPLIFAGKKFKHKEIETPVSLIDLFPTVLDLTNIKTKKFTPAGSSLLKLRSRPVFATGTLYLDEKYSVIKAGLTWIFNSGKNKNKMRLLGPSSEEKYELFDLNSDPFEKRNFYSEESAAFSKLKKELDKFIKLALPSQGRKISIEKEKKIKEQLKSLGYL